MRTRLLPVRLSSQVCVIAYDSHALLSGELMRGFERGWPWLTVALSALGGIAVSMALKYADNILKTFAVGCSIVLNCAISSLFLGVPLSLAVIAGVLLVVGSTFLFNARCVHAIAYRPTRPPSPPSPSPPHRTRCQPKVFGSHYAGLCVCAAAAAALLMPLRASCSRGRVCARVCIDCAAHREKRTAAPSGHEYHELFE